MEEKKQAFSNPVLVLWKVCHLMFGDTLCSYRLERQHILYSFTIPGGEGTEVGRLNLLIISGSRSFVIVINTFLSIAIIKNNKISKLF